MAGLSIRARLILLVLLAIVPAAALLLYNARESRRAALAAAEEKALRLVSAVSHEQQHLVKSTHQLLMGLGQLREIRGGDAARCSSILAELIRAYPVYANLGVIAPDGRLFCSAVPISGEVQASDRTYFQRAFATRAFAVGDYQIGRVTGRAAINVAYPVLDDRDAVQAVVFAALDVERLNELLVHAVLPPGSRFTIVDQSGTILVRHPHPEEWVGRSLPAAPDLAAIRAQRAGVTEVVDPDGTVRVLGFAPLLDDEAATLYVSVGIPKSVVLAETHRILVRNLLALGGVAALALLAAWVGSEIVVLRPLKALITVTKRLAGGDLSVRAGGGYAGEVGHLARAFDHMAAALETRQAAFERAGETLRRTSELLRSLVHASPVAITVLDARGTVRVWNPAAERLFGWAEHEVLGRPHPIVPGEHEREFRDRLHRAGTGEVFEGVEVSRRARHGAVVDVACSCAPLHAADGTVTGVLVMYADLSDRKRAEAELARQQTAAARSERLAALGRLAAGVGHELKNPLAVIGARTQLLRRHMESREAVAPDDLGRHVASLEEAQARMVRIMGALSTYTRPADSQAMLLDVGELLRAIKELVVYQAKVTDIQVELDIPTGLSVWGDRTALMQIFLNLATNATEAMAQRGGRLTLRARAGRREPRCDDPGAAIPESAVIVEVVDTGPGIPPDVLPKIWDPFFTTKPEGTGLGLSIVRGLVEDIPGASIAVESSPEGGATFRLTLPAGTAASARPGDGKSLNAEGAGSSAVASEVSPTGGTRRHLD